MGKLVKAEAALPVHVVEDRVVQRLLEAETALSFAVGVDQVKLVMDVAAAQEVFAKRQHLGEGVIGKAHSLKIHALIRLAELVQSLVKSPGAIGAPGPGRGKRGIQQAPRFTPPTLADLKIDKKTANVARRVLKLPTATREQVAQREVTLKEAEKAIRVAVGNTKRSEAVATAKTTTAETDATIRHESFTITADGIQPSSVSLVFTDPPYHDQTIGVYADLGSVSARVLKDGGSLITYTSHHRLPEVIAMLQAAGLTFFWPLAMVHTGQKARMTEYGIVVHWKPLLWFVKGKFRSREDLRFVNDLVESKPEKDAHPWQQGTIEARYYIEALTQPGDLVFDPFCGGGTTAVAAALTTRRWLTCDVDEEAVWIARQRLREAVA